MCARLNAALVRVPVAIECKWDKQGSEGQVKHAVGNDNTHVSLGVLAQRSDVGQVVDVKVSAKE